METCQKCQGDGLTHQGESIHKVCAYCKGTGKVGELSEVTSSYKMENEEEVVAPAEESPKGDSGDESAVPSEESEAAPAE